MPRSRRGSTRGSRRDYDANAFAEAFAAVPVPRELYEENNIEPPADATTAAVVSPQPQQGTQQNPQQAIQPNEQQQQQQNQIPNPAQREEDETEARERLRRRTNELLTPINIKKNRRAGETINGNESENAKFILWLVDNEHAHILSPSLLQLIQSCKGSEAYERAWAELTKYHLLVKVVREFISDDLYDLNVPPFDFNAVTHHLFTDYLLSHRNREGGPLKKKVYSNKRTALHWIHKKYKYKRTEEFDEEV